MNVVIDSQELQALHTENSILKSKLNLALVKLELAKRFIKPQYEWLPGQERTCAYCCGICNKGYPEQHEADCKFVIFSKMET